MSVITSTSSRLSLLSEELPSDRVSEYVLLSWASSLYHLQIAVVLVSLYTTLYSHSVSQEGLAHKFCHLSMLGTTESVGMRLHYFMM